MNLDIIVKPIKDGIFTVVCPNFPGCESEGATVEEALNTMIDKISETVAGNIKTNLKGTFKEMYMDIASKGPINVPLMMSKLPLSLN